MIEIAALIVMATALLWLCWHILAEASRRDGDNRFDLFTGQRMPPEPHRKHWWSP